MGNGLSLTGTWMQRIACSWLVWDWTHSAFWVGILAAADLLPVVLVGPFAGVAADRWNRLRQNILAQILSACLAVLMAILLATGNLGLVGIVTLISLQGALTAAIQPARLAMVQQMVPREEMRTAVALSSVNVNLTRLLGPALAGTMILHWDIYWVFIINAAVNAVFVLILTRLRLTPQTRQSGDSSFLMLMAEGFAHIRHSPELRLMLLALLCGGVLVRAVVELIPAIAANAFANDAVGLAVLTGATASGAIISGLTIHRRALSGLLYRAPICWAVGALAAIALTLAARPDVATGAAMLIGGAVTRALITTQTFVQLTTPDILRGRVLSVHGLIARGSPALGALTLGYAADRIGMGPAVVTSSALLILALLALLPLIHMAARTTVAEPTS